jgi:hypothetical protein
VPVDGAGHPGHEQPGELLTVGRRRALLLAGLVVLGGAGLVRAGSGEPTRPIVLVSGRDDHRALAAETVALLAASAAEGAGEVVATVGDGTLVRVVDADGGSWLEVVTLDGGTRGWVDDFHLRGTVHVVGQAEACPTPLHADVDGPVLDVLRPSEQVELVDDHTTPQGETWVGVRTVQGGTLGLVPAARLREQPGAQPRPGTPCAEVEPDPEAVGHRH